MAQQAISDLLSANLKWLIGEHKDELDSSTKIADKTKTLGHRGVPRVSQRTVHRAIVGKDKSTGKPTVTTTDSLVGMAAAFGIEPWQLLHPDLPVMVSQQKLSLEETTKVQRIREAIAELSEPAQTELFGNSETVKELFQSGPYPSKSLVEKGWSAAGKPVSRRSE